jgi:RNA methyltransferase, TrmH family
MITLRKLQRLPPATRLRKIARLLDGFVEYRSPPEAAYLDGLLRLIRETQPGLANAVPPFSDADTDAESAMRWIDGLRYQLRARLGIAPGDWDLLPPAGFGASGGAAAVHDPVDSSGCDRSVSVYLESIRSPFNAGSIIRTAAALGVARIGMSPDCPPTDHPRLVRTARGAERSVSIHRLPLSELSTEWWPLVALETGGHPVDTFEFPQTGTLLVGSEELGLSREALDAAEDRLSIRMTAVKGSINVGVACGIALHAWCVKAQMSDGPDD